HVYALRASDGHPLWKEGTSGARFGFGSGQFYATASVAFGRVFIGNTDGFVYSYAEHTGALAWRHRTGGYVYSSAAVADPHGKPPVYVGSYDRSLYALDARTGRPRWVHPAGGRISGGIMVIGDLVFYSTLEHRTVAVGVNNGNTVWSVAHGAFNPV